MNEKHMTTWFRQAAPYIQAHRGKTFVLAFSGEVVAHANFTNLIHDIALLNSLGIKLVLVYGIRPQMNAMLEKANHQQDIVNDWRITDDTCLSIAQQAAGHIRCQIEALFSMGLPNTLFPTRSINITSGNFVVAKPFGIHGGTNYLHTGTVRKINQQAIQQQLNNDNIVCLSPLGYSPTGEVLNCKYEELAFNTAIHLQADKLIYIASENLVDEEKSIISELSLENANAIKTQLNFSKEIINHIEAGIEAVNAGINRVHLLSCENDGSLLTELFTQTGQGTLLSNNPSEIIRQANIDDASGILKLITPMQEKGVLVTRSLEQLEIDIKHFTVLEYEGEVIACAALYHYEKDNMAELACIVTDEDHQHKHLGRRLLKQLELQAKSHNCQQLFVLTTQTSHWFEEQGFTKGDIESLPMDKQALYNYQRNSLVLFKNI